MQLHNTNTDNGQSLVTEHCWNVYKICKLQQMAKVTTGTQ